MAMSASRWAIVAVFLVIGLYFLIWHMDPLPGNHEAVGLGKNHLVHGLIGIVLLGAAGFIWYTARKAAAGKPTP